jgi:hypothetical protein
LEELHRLCRLGRLYDVERWIRAGRPLQLAAGSPAERRRHRSALEIALDRQDHSLILLLVANGFDLALEPKCPLDEAVRLRRGDLLDLLLEWGADPQRVDLDILFETYDSLLFERFRGLGVDLTAGHALAYALGYHTSNKPLLGFAKRHRLDEPRIQTALDIALAHHAGEGHEKGVMLCIWAGADAHAPVPNMNYMGLRDDEEDEDEGRSAIQEACSGGHASILERLRPDPARDDYEELFFSAANEEVIAILARSTLPKDSGRVVALQLARANWPFHDHRPVEALRALFAAGVRWQTSPVEEIASARRDLLRCSDYLFADLMKLLATADHCSREVLTERPYTDARPHGGSPDPRLRTPGVLDRFGHQPRGARQTGVDDPSRRRGLLVFTERSGSGDGTERGSSFGSIARRSSSASGPCRWRRWRRNGASQAAGSRRPAGASGYPFRRADTGQGWQLVSGSADHSCRVFLRARLRRSSSARPSRRASSRR